MGKSLILLNLMWDLIMILLHRIIVGLVMVADPLGKMVVAIHVKRSAMRIRPMVGLLGITTLLNNVRENSTSINMLCSLF